MGAGSYGPGIRRGTMLDIIRNPVVISVITDVVLCLLKLNVLLVPYHFIHGGRDCRRDAD